MADFRKELSEAILAVLRASPEPVEDRVVAASIEGATVAEVRSFLRRELADRVAHAGANAWTLADRLPSLPAGEPPVCPRCGARLEIRKWRRPPHAGRKFWGCSRYREKKCGYTRGLAPGEKPPPPAPAR